MPKISMEAARVNAKMSQEQAAKALNVSRMTISNWETGKSSPNAKKVIEIADTYKMPMDCIFFG